MIQSSSGLTGGYFFELGRLYDRAGNANSAFAAFTTANWIHGQVAGHPGAAQRCRDTVAYCRKNFTAELAKDSCPMPPPDGRPNPVFLIGFPRSGTTLLDQILSSHPGIFVAEEKGGIDKAICHFALTFGERHRDATIERARAQGMAPWHASNPCYPVDLNQLRTQDIAAMREIFYQQNGVVDGDARIAIDKMPLNTLHAGFIKRLFPNAKFILALRHPCDVVLSCFMQQFDLNGHMQRFLDLGESARFYDEVFDMWVHYQSIFDLDVHVVRYEDVVSDFRSTVTEKIYTRAAGRWQRYYTQMGPVLPVLAPWAKKFGYSVDLLPSTLKRP
jgi:hypothetical protein